MMIRRGLGYKREGDMYEKEIGVYEHRNEALS